MAKRKTGKDRRVTRRRRKATGGSRPAKPATRSAGRKSGKRQTRKPVAKKPRQTGRAVNSRAQSLKKAARQTVSARKRPLKKRVQRAVGRKRAVPHKPTKDRKAAGAPRSSKKPIQKPPAANKAVPKRTASKSRTVAKARAVSSQPKKAPSPPRAVARPHRRSATRLPHLDRVRRVLQDPELPPPLAPSPSEDRLFVAHGEPDDTPQAKPAVDSAVTPSGETTAPSEAQPASATASKDKAPVADDYESLRLRWEQEPPDTKD